MSQKTIIEEIRAERRRQMDVEGWTPHHDDGHAGGELARMAACYAAFHETLSIPKRHAIDDLWPWGDFLGRDGEKKIRRKTPRERLVIAGALILAEIERLDRRSEDADAIDQ